MNGIGQLFEKRMALCQKLIVWGDGRLSNSNLSELSRINTQISNLMEWLPIETRDKLMTEITNADKQLAEQFANAISGIVKIAGDIALQEQKTRICQEISILEVRLAEKQAELLKLTKQKEEL